MMKENDAVQLLKMITSIDVDVWLDGGWGVDALLGYESRPHNDIDLFVEKRNLEAFTELLLSQGYREVKMDYTVADHTAWRDEAGREIDLHLFEFAADGTLLFLKEAYPADLLEGRGKIGGLSVRCLTVWAQLLYHQGYEYDENDIHDVWLLCKTFALEIPAEYKDAVAVLPTKTLTTSRLILRRWMESDAEKLYEYAKNPLIGPIAGWPVHTSVENSRQVIREVLSAKETYAVTVKGDHTAIGSVGILIGSRSNLSIPEKEAEIGYWIAQPFWGQGMIPEAVHEMMGYAFLQLGMSALWCGYFDGNEKSKRVNEKCGFTFHHTEHEKWCPLIHAVKTLHVTRITKEEWQTPYDERL